MNQEIYHFRALVHIRHRLGVSGDQFQWIGWDRRLRYLLEYYVRAPRNLPHQLQRNNEDNRVTVDQHGGPPETYITQREELCWGVIRDWDEKIPIRLWPSL